jgi:hypothetical protein
VTANETNNETRRLTMTVTIASYTTGTRTIAGTDWTVSDEVQRQEYSGRVEWVVVRGICNGTAASSTSYRTRREALLAFPATLPTGASYAVADGRRAVGVDADRVR